MPTRDQKKQAKRSFQKIKASIEKKFPEVEVWYAGYMVIGGKGAHSISIDNYETRQNHAFKLRLSILQRLYWYSFPFTCFIEVHRHHKDWGRENNLKMFDDYNKYGHASDLPF